MDQITDDWIAYLWVFNHVGVVEADDVGTTEVDFVLRVIKDPAETVSSSPFADIGIGESSPVLGSDFWKLEILRSAIGVSSMARTARRISSSSAAE